MRYEGKRETIEEIEKEIKANVLFCVPYNLPKYDNLFGIESVVKTEVFDVVTKNFRFPVRLFYDGRDGTGAIDIRDRDVGCMIGLSSKIIPLLAELQPRVNKKREMLNGRRKKIELPTSQAEPQTQTQTQIQTV